MVFLSLSRVDFVTNKISKLGIISSSVLLMQQSFIERCFLGERWWADKSAIREIPER